MRFMKCSVKEMKILRATGELIVSSPYLTVKEKRKQINNLIKGYKCHKK